MSRAVALLSGGLDSGVALALWAEQANETVLCLFADYGQRAAQPERRASQALAQRFTLPWRAIGLPWLADAARTTGSRLIAGTGALPEGTIDAPGDQSSANAVWVPARNLVLVAAAAAFGEALRADVVLAGFNREEAATFPDNSAAFVERSNDVLALATRTGVRLASPTLNLDKRGIVAHARRLGLRPHDFWSCYEDRATPCGSCESCARSARAWA